jgi:hypothetical protein
MDDREKRKLQFKGTARKNPGASPGRFNPQKAQDRSRDADTEESE